MFSFFKRKKPAQDALDEVIAAPEAPPDEARLAQALASMQAAADAPPSGEAAAEPDGVAEAAVEPVQPPDAWSDRPDVATPADAPPEAGSWLSRLRRGLSRTGQSIGGLFVGVKVDESLFDELETALIMADAGVEATERLLTALRAR